MTIPGYSDAPAAPCGCYACDGSPVMRSRMYVCQTCGSKRCPSAMDHRNQCPNGPSAVVTVTDRIAELEAAFAEALDEFDDALGYVPAWAMDKWGYRETVARLRKVQGGAPSAEPAPTVKAGEEQP